MEAGVAHPPSDWLITWLGVGVGVSLLLVSWLAKWKMFAVCCCDMSPPIDKILLYCTPFRVTCMCKYPVQQYFNLFYIY